MDPRAEMLIELLTRDLSRLSISGVTRELRTSRRWDTKVQMQDGLLRLEEPPGVFDIGIGRDRGWDGRSRGRGEVREVPRDRVLPMFGLPEVVERYPVHPDYWREWFELDPQLVVDSLRPTRLHGRDAWRFTCPEVKGRNMVVTVDAGTGVLLRMEAADVGVVVEWLWLDLVSRIDEAVFEYEPSPSGSTPRRE